RRRSSPYHPAFSSPAPSPTGKSWVGVASLGIKQRERVVLSVFWQLLFCRLFNESAYRHLDLQFYNLFACRNPTSPGVDAPSTFRRMHNHYSISLDSSQVEVCVFEAWTGWLA